MAVFQFSSAGFDVDASPEFIRGVEIVRFLAGRCPNRHWRRVQPGRWAEKEKARLRVAAGPWGNEIDYFFGSAAAGVAAAPAAGSGAVAGLAQ